MQDSDLRWNSEAVDLLLGENEVSVCVCVLSGAGVPKAEVTTGSGSPEAGWVQGLGVARSRPDQLPV